MESATAANQASTPVADRGFVSLAPAFAFHLNLGFVVRCLVGLTLLVLSSAHAVVPTFSNREQIKDFLRSPPAIEYLMVKSTNNASWVLSQGGVMPSVGDPSIIIYQGARQDDSFYLRSGFVPTDENAKLGTNSHFLAGRSGHVVWHAGSFFAAKTVLSTEEAQAFPYNRGTNNIVRFATTTALLLNRFLDLGLIDIKPGSYVFDGNKFNVDLNRGGSAQGELIEEQGVVTAIRFHIIGHNKYVVSHFEYGGANEVPSFLPRRVVQNVYGSNGNIVRTSLDFTFLRLRLASGLLPDTHFLPDRFYSAAHGSGTTIQMEFTNGTLYRRDGARLVAVPQGKSEMPATSGRAFFYGSLVILTVIPLFVIFRKAAAHNQDKANGVKTHQH